jgi:hypothetical protein
VPSVTIGIPAIVKVPLPFTSPAPYPLPHAEAKIADPVK